MTEGAKNSEVEPKSRGEGGERGEGRGEGGLELSVSLSPPGKSTYKSNDSALKPDGGAEAAAE